MFKVGDEIFGTIDENNSVVTYGYVWKPKGKSAEFNVAHWSLYKKLSDLRMDLATLEAVVLGRCPIKAASLPPNCHFAMISGLDPAEANKTVSTGSVKIASGPKMGETFKFKKINAYFCGISLDQADLLYLFKPFDRVIVEVDNANEIKIHIGSVREPGILFAEEDRMLVHVWLVSHLVTIQEFKDVLNGNASFKYFIPFPGDMLKGRIVSLDASRGAKIGVVSGAIKIDEGYICKEGPKEAAGSKMVADMAGKIITFHRSTLWVYGRKLAKGDIAHVIPDNQIVYCEAKEMTEEEKARLSSMMPANCNHRATIVWIGPSRPRNDKDDPSRNDASVFEWIARRNMNINMFNALIEGRLHTVNPMMFGPRVNLSSERKSE